MPEFLILGCLISSSILHKYSLLDSPHLRLQDKSPLISFGLLVQQIHPHLSALPHFWHFGLLIVIVKCITILLVIQALRHLEALLRSFPSRPGLWDLGHWLKSCWSFCVCVVLCCAGVLPFWVPYLPNPLTDFFDIWRIGSPYLHPPNFLIRLAISFFVVEIFSYLCHPPPALCQLHPVRSRDPLTQFTSNFTHRLTPLFSLYPQIYKSF